MAIAAAPVVLVAAVLGVEVQLARRGPPVGEPPPGIDGCYGCEAASAPERVVWLGDSTAAGIGVEAAAEVLGPQVATRLGRPTSLADLAVSGARVDDVVERQIPALRGAGSVDVVAVSVGSNDVTHLTSARSFRRSFRRLLTAVPPGVQVVVLGVPDLGSPPRLLQPLRMVAGWRGRALDDIVRAEAARRGATYVDIAGETGESFRRDRTLFAADGYHPSARGYALWAQAVAERWPQR